MATCCPTTMKPVASGYARRGFSNYLAGVGTSTKGIVFVPDIFGLHPNAYQFADVLSSHGFVVVIPDLFPDNSHWPPEKPLEGPEWATFVGRITNFPYFVEEVKKAAHLLKSLGCTSVGVVGMCWGAKVALKALKEGIVQCCAGPHPSFLALDDVKPTTGPICLLMSKDEQPYLDVKEELATNSFAGKNVFVRFDDLYHGFLGARGPLEKAWDFNCSDAIAARVVEASDTVVNFFKANL